MDPALVTFGAFVRERWKLFAAGATALVLIAVFVIVRTSVGSPDAAAGGVAIDDVSEQPSDPAALPSGSDAPSSAPSGGTPSGSMSPGAPAQPGSPGTRPGSAQQPGATTPSGGQPSTAPSTPGSTPSTAPTATPSGSDPTPSTPGSDPSSTPTQGTPPSESDPPDDPPPPPPTEPPPPPGPRTQLTGVTDDSIKVVYYWKGDQTRNSQYLHGSGVEGNVDEAQAFRNLVKYVNAHAGADDPATFMGFDFDLHGRTLEGVVVEVLRDQEAAGAEKIRSEEQPMVAIASHGSVSAYVCPFLAEAGIHNLSVLDLDFDLQGRTNGYCTPNGPSWDRQVDIVTGYLARQATTTKYAGTLGEEDRVYGFLYTEYPGLVDSAPVIVERLRAAGINIPELAVETLSPSLATAQTQAPNVVASFRDLGVNTVIMPDAGAPLNFTHAAAAQQFRPDYLVWPCSGMDTPGMVRLFDPDQWERAAGMTCYDQQFNPDLVHGTEAQQTEWYQHYQEGAGGSEDAPSPTALVYASLLPFLVGVTYAGEDLTLETFRAGLDGFQQYRYDAHEGATTDPTNLLLSFNEADRSLFGDVTEIEWSNSNQTQGSALRGAYTYVGDGRRYARSDDF